MRKLDELLADLVDDRARRACGETRVSGVFDDSRHVAAGGLFVAIEGAAVDGRCFIQDALRRGATAVLGANLPPVSPPAVAIECAAPRRVLAQLAWRWYDLDQHARSTLQLVGVTGTNGKSTVAHLTRAILRAAERRCALLGTVEYDTCDGVLPAKLTTPGPLDIGRLLRRAVDAGATAAVLEVSSHALALDRTYGLPFRVGAFTNLTQDHLDFHGSMESYAAAKALLFEQLDNRAAAVVNGDDAWADRMLRDCGARRLTFGFDDRADIAGRVLATRVDGVSFELKCEQERATLRTRLIGRHNVANALAATGIATALGVKWEAIVAGLEAVEPVRGRLERIDGVEPLSVFIDFAHTPDALDSVCRVLKPLARGRLIVVFGCGGDRDKTKRPLMGQAAARFADVLLLTSDNPRSEDPQSIANDVLGGLEDADRRKTVVEHDRRTAIKLALAAAEPDDIVLVAGKGHERYQIVGAERLPFDDARVVREVVAATPAEV